MASDSVSLARWWTRLCRGDLVSEASLTEMATVRDGEEYGLGLLDGMAWAHDAPSVGHGGIQVGFTAWAMCFVEDGTVVVVLTHREDPRITIDVANALAGAARSD